ncbi:S41 family peptidase [Paenibacillus sacheonensis]|uniref:S41 family peptidase n=1 Tax=Paenibacillus sacheonensis TaxID=742054 RepID=UPI003D15FE6B
MDPTGENIPYAGKVTILVDSFTGSAAEDFVLPFMDNARAVIIGERRANQCFETLMTTISL